MNNCVLGQPLNGDPANKEPARLAVKDDLDIERERRALAVRGNMLARRFAACSKDVKRTLFKVEKTRPNFRRQRPTTSSTTTTERSTATVTAAADESGTTRKYNRRINSKYEKRANNNTRVKRPPFLKQGSSAVVTSEQVTSRNDVTRRAVSTTHRPFIRSRTNITGGGASRNALTSTTEVPTLQETTRRLPNRLVGRRRPTSIRVTTTISPKAGNVGSIDQAVLESIEKESGNTSHNSLRIDKHITSNNTLSTDLQSHNTSTLNRDSKKYSSSYKSNQLDEIKSKNIGDKDQSTEAVYELTPESAVVLAAHQLLGAPLPTTPNYDQESTTQRSSSKTTNIPRKPIQTTETTRFYETTYPKIQETTKKSTLNSRKTYTTNEGVYFETTNPASFHVPSKPKSYYENSYSSTQYPLDNSYVRIGEFLDNAGKFISVPIDEFAIPTETYHGINQEPAYFTRDYLLESPITKTFENEYQYLSTVSTPVTEITTDKKERKRISTTLAPPVVIQPRRMPDRKVKVYEKLPTVDSTNKKAVYKLIENYDYYDDSNEKVYQRYQDGQKVVVRGKGDIQCLDQGNFQHPTSCKKFISCSRMERGGLYGWEYTCPKGLSYDPIGGICNWAAGLGCKEV